MMKKRNNKICRLFSIIVFCFLFQRAKAITPEFLSSFIQFYELSNEGRFTHEYHPFLLKRTAASFQDLENKLAESGCQLAHRILIMGYEKAAAPHYFFNPQESKGTVINDEMLNKTLFGFTQKNHNLFGFMTGFLFRQMPSTKDFFTTHINPNTIILFDSRAQRFQQDFFGSMYYFLHDKEYQITKALFQQKGDLLMRECIDFWNTLYMQNTMNKEHANSGTQDILFTIEHAHQIKDSKVPLKAFFTGADITYPINETSKKKQSATRNAQKMVGEFSEHLKPINDQSTLYVFRSFVDGVGKSTMLSNIKNWKKYKTDISSYKTTDNASSQTAEIFEYDDQVFIADLPAQLSHFTYKPDGVVFVEYEACSDLSITKDELLAHIQHNKKEIEATFYQAVQKIKALPYSSLSVEKTDTDFMAYIKNLILLESAHPYQWIAFVYKNQTFIFDKGLQIRLAVPLSKAPSEGLKNSAPEQMLFTAGIRFPLPYNFFLDDLILQVKKYDIKQVVFVDFLSMYARSSREAIRLNYLIQQIKALFPSMNYQESFYAHFSSNAEVLYRLMQPDFFQKSLEYINAESFIRLELFKYIDQEIYQDLEGVSFNQLSSQIHQSLLHIPSALEVQQKKLIYKKIDQTKKMLQEKYRHNKEYVHLFMHDGSELYRISKRIEKTFSHISFPFKNPWKHNGKRVLEQEEVATGHCDRTVELDTGQKMRVLYVFDPKDASLLQRAEFFSLLKKWWIPTLLSGMKVDIEHEKMLLRKMHFPLAPLLIKKGYNNFWYCVQPVLSLAKNIGGQKLNNDLQIQNKQKVSWGYLEATPLIIDFAPIDTHSGIYGFGYSSIQSFSYKKFPQMFDDAVSQAVKPLFESIDPSDTISLSTVVKTLKQENKYSLFKWCLKECKKSMQEVQKQDTKNKEKPKKGAFKTKIIKGVKKESLPWVLELSELLATVFLHAPDLHSSFSFELNNQEEFAAALWLIRKILLPQYLGIYYLKDKRKKSSFKHV